MSQTEYLWVEKYRPQTIEDCILPDRLKNVFREQVKSGQLQNMLLVGTSGVGKTTVARALCRDMGLAHQIINSSSERGIDTLRVRIREYAQTVSLQGGYKVQILDEADGVTRIAQDALRGTIEEFSKNCKFIMTCNFKSKMIDALLSRLVVVDFNLYKDERVELAGKFFHRVQDILWAEKIAFDSKVVAMVVKRHFPDFRKTLNELQRLASNDRKTIDSESYRNISSGTDLKELLAHLKDKDFTAMRKWVVENGSNNTDELFREIYDALVEVMQPHSVPNAVVILARYADFATRVSDKEINMVACLSELMVDCEYK